MEGAGGREGGIAQLVGRGDVEDDVVGREFLADGDEVDGDTCCRGRLAVGAADGGV